MGAVTSETCRVTLQWNKSDCILLHIVGLLFNVNYDARNHELKIYLSTVFAIPMTHWWSTSPISTTFFLIRHRSVFLISLYERLIRNDTTTRRIILFLFLRLITHTNNSKLRQVCTNMFNYIGVYLFTLTGTQCHQCHLRPKQHMRQW